MMNAANKLLGLFLLATAVSVGGLAGETSSALQPERIAHEPEWAGRQFLGADQEGNVFLLDAEHLTIYPLTRGGELGAPRAGEALGEHSLGAGGTILAAQLSPNGRRWLLHIFGGRQEIRLLEAGEERVVSQPNWRVTGIGFRGNDPLVAVAPLRRSHSTTEPFPKDPPVLQVLTGQEWESLVRERLDVDLKQPGDLFARLSDPREAVLGAGRESSIWVAQRYAYRVRQWSGGGRLLREITVGDGRIEYREKDEKDLEALHETLEQAVAGGQTIPEGMAEGLASQKSAKRVLEVVTEGRDGRLYLLVAAGSSERPTLDRFDPTLGTLERVELVLPPYRGRWTMAAGTGGLYLAPLEAAGGRYQLRWEALDGARWKPVPMGAGGSGADRPEAAP